MVGIVSGNSAGLITTSASVLGDQGVIGTSVTGNAKEGAYVNISNGNLILHDQDDFLASVGMDVAFTRTYNSQGTLNGVAPLRTWKAGLEKTMTGLTGTVNTAGSTITRAAGDGSRTVFTYDATRAAYMSTDGGGAYQSIVFNDTAQQWTWRADQPDQLGPQEVYDAASGRITRASDGQAGNLTYAYTSAGRISQVTDGSGDVTVFHYDAADNLSYVGTKRGTSAELVRVYYTYDQLNRLTGVAIDLQPEATQAGNTQVRRYTTTYTYDGTSNRIASLEQQDGTRLAFEYEQVASAATELLRWKIHAFTDALGRRTLFDYSVAKQTTVTDPMGNQAVYRYDTSGQLTEVAAPPVNGVQLKQQFTYDAKGNLLTATDAAGSVTTYTYDANGNWVSKRNPDDSLVTRTYSLLNNKLLTETVGRPDELVANPNFLSGAANWIIDPANQGSTSTVDGSLTVKRGNWTGFDLVSQKISGLVVGQTYVFSMTATSSEGNTSLMVSSPGSDGLMFGQDYRPLAYLAPSEQQSSYTFVAISTTVYISMQSIGTGSVSFKEISLKPAIAGELLPPGPKFLAGLGTTSVNATGEVTLTGNATSRATATQRIRGLVPGMRYKVSWASKAGAASTATVMIGQYESMVYTNSVNQSTTYQLNSATFVADSDLATIFLGVLNANETATFKDFSLKEDQPHEVVVNGSFNFGGSTGAWTVDNTEGASVDPSSYGYLKISAPTPGGSNTYVKQSFTTIPGKTYKISGQIASLSGYNNSAIWIGTSDKGKELFSDGGANKTVNGTFVAAGTKTFITLYSYQGDQASAKFDDISITLATPIAQAATPGLVLTTRLVYDSAGRQRFVVTPEGGVTEYRYDALGQRTATIDYSGNVFDTGSLPAQSAPTEAALVAWIAGLDKTKTRRTDYSYDVRGLLAYQTSYAKTDANGAGIADGTQTVQHFVYDQAGQLLVSFDPRNSANTSSYTYDGLGRLLSSTDALQHSTVTTYDDAHNTITARLANGLSRVSVFDRAGQLVSMTELDTSVPLLGTTSYFYDADGRQRMAQGPTGQRSFTLYDAAGRRSASIDADGSVTEYFYNLNSQLSRSRQYATRLTSAALAALADATGKPVIVSIDSVRPALDAAKDRSNWNIYDTLGRLTDSVDGAGALTRRVYDTASRLIQVIEYATPLSPAALANVNVPVSFTAIELPSDDRVTRSFYDKDSHLVGQLDSAGYLTERVYDAAGRLIASVRYDTLTAVAARAAGTLASLRPATSSKDVTERYFYNGEGQLVGTLDGESYLSETSYDAAGNILRTTRYADRVNYTATATLDSLRPQTAKPDDRIVQFVYDAVNQLTRKIGSDGLVTTYDYNNVGTVIASTVAFGTSAASTGQMRFDSQGRVTAQLGADGAARLAGLSDQAAINAVWAAYAVQFTYDAAGHRTSMTDPNGNRTLYYYDGDGRLASTVNALGQVQGQTYNAFGQVERATQYFNTIAADTVTALRGGQMDAAFSALLAALASADDLVQTFSYDQEGRVADQVDAKLFHATTSYDAFGSAISSTDFSTAGTVAADTARDVTVRTLYDLDGRVSATVNGIGTVNTYQYDGSGNVTDRISFAKPIDIASSVAAIKLAIQNNTLANSDAAQPLDQHERFVYDKLGRVTASFTALQRDGATQRWSVVTQSYDSSGNVSMRTAWATPLTVALPTAANLSALVSSPSDAVTCFSYDSANRIIGTASAQGGSGTSRTWTVTGRAYDKAGNLTVSTGYAALLTGANPDAAAVNAFIAAQTNPNSADAITRFVYDSANRVVATAVTQGLVDNKLQWSVTSQTYDKAGNLVERKEFANTLGSDLLPANPTAAQYQQWISNGPVADAGIDRVTRFGYDALNRVNVTIDAAGGVSTLAYDSYGNVVRRTAYAKATGWVGTITSAFVPAESANDRTSRTLYDKNNRAVFDIDAKGDVAERRYDAHGNLVATLRYATPVTATAIGDRSTAAQLAQLVLPQEGTARIERHIVDQAGRVRFAIDAGGYVIESQYDALGRVIKTLQHATPNLLVATDVAATAATLLAPQAGAARINSFTYDAQGRMLSSTDALQATERYGYDALGRKLTFTNKVGNTWTYTYDAAGRLLTETAPPVDVYVHSVLDATDPAQARAHGLTAIVTRNTYDAFGNVSTRTEALGIAGQERVTTYAYDLMGRQIRTTLPSVKIYDASIDPLSSAGAAARYEKDSGPLTITVTYDAFGDAISNIDVGGNLSQKSYDKLGQVRYEMDAGGQVTGYERDSFGQVTSLTRYAKALGQPILLQDVNKVALALSAVFSPDSRTIKTEYDVLGRATRVTEPTVFVYDPTSTQASNYVLAAKTTDTGYNAFGDVIVQSVYGADSNGNRITAAQTTQFYVDARGLKTASVQAVTADSAYVTTFAYDLAGNLSTRIEYQRAITSWGQLGYSLPAADVLDRKTSFTYDAADRMLTQTQVGAGYATLNAATGIVSDSAAGAASDITTRYGYDALGNQISVTDALGSATYTYRDILGRVTAVAKVQTGVPAGSVPIVLTEFKLDVYGNVVLRIDRAKGASSAPLPNAGMAAATPDSVNDRVSATVYDSSGRTVQVLDAANHLINTSYDKFGRAVKQWRSVTGLDGVVQTAYQVTVYDALGHIERSDAPLNADILTGTTTALSKASTFYGYNAFGELTTSFVSAAGTPSTVTYTDYDNAGRAWRTNSGDGVDKVTLFDAQGQATSQIRSRSISAPHLLKDQLTVADNVTTLDNVLRTDTRYDLLGHVVDVSTIDTIAVMRRDPVTSSWVPVQQASYQPDDYLIVAGPEDQDKTVTVRYRLKGSGAWIDGSATRVQLLNGYRVFATAGLASGQYEYQVTLQLGSYPAYEAANGTLTIDASSTQTKAKRIIALFAAVLNRAPSLGELNSWVARANGGAGMAQLALELFNTSEGLQRFPAPQGSQENLTATVQQILLDAFGRPQSADPAYQADVAHYVSLFGMAGTAQGDNRGQALLDMIDEIALKPADSAALRMSQRINNVFNYVVTNLGNNAANAARVFFDGADGTALAAGERYRIQIAQLYVTLLGRMPSQIEMDGWIASAFPIETVGNGILGTLSALEAPMYPTGMSNTDLIMRAYQNMLGRAPSATELATWSAKLAGGVGIMPISRGAFALQLSASVSGYTGSDSAARTEMQVYNEKVSVALSAALDARHNDSIETSRAVLLAITASTSAKAAIDKAELALKSAQAAAINAASAAAAGADATPVEQARVKLARLYVGLLNRVPDSAGLAFYMAYNAAHPNDWEAIAAGFLSSSEVDPQLKGSTLGNDAFVRRIYANATSNGNLTDAAASAEIAKLVARLDSSATRASVALAAIDGLLGTASLSDSERALRAVFDTKVAVGLVYALELNGTNAADAASVAASISATTSAGVVTTNMAAAVQTAYTLVQAANAGTVAALASAAQDARTGVDALAAASAAAAIATTTAQVANTAVASLTPGTNGPQTVPFRLQIMQLYLAVLGRGSASFAGATAMNNFEFYSAYSDIGAIAQFFFDAPEGQGLYPPLSEGAAPDPTALVERIYANVLGADYPGQKDVAGWAQKLSGPGALSAGQVALGIIDSVIGYQNTDPDQAAHVLLSARAAFLARVADAFAVLDTEEDAAAQTASSAQALSRASYDTATAAVTAATLAVSTTSADKTTKVSRAAGALSAVDSAGDGSATRRLQITQWYAALLQRSSAPRLDEVDFYIDHPMSYAQVAQYMIDSPEGAILKAADDEQFVRLLFSRILGREMDEGDSLASWVALLTTGPNASDPGIRGQLAYSVMTAFQNYTDNKASQLASKLAFDANVFDFISTEYAEAQAIAATVRDLYTDSLLANARLTGLSYAITTATNNAADAYTAQGQDLTALLHVNLALGGGTTLHGLANQIRTYPSRAGLINSFIGSYPSDRAAFVRQLYSTVLGRADKPGEVQWYLDNWGTNTYTDIAGYFVDSSEAHTRLDASAQQCLNAVNKEIAAAFGAITTAQTDYANGQAAAIAATARYEAALPATGKAAALAQLVGMYPTVLDADRATLDAAQAQSTLNAAQARLAQLKPAYERLVLDTNATVLRFNAEHATCNLARANAARAAADVAVAVSKVADRATSVPAQQVRKIVQLYVMLSGRGPAPAEALYWQAQLDGGHSMTDVANGIMARDGARDAAFNMTSCSNDAFVNQLYLNGFGRSVYADAGLAFWGSQLSGPGAKSRADLAILLIDGSRLSANDDTKTFSDRVSAGLQAIAAQGSAPGAIDLKPYADLANFGALIETAGEQAAKDAAKASIDVARIYLTLLNRAPDPAGMDFWIKAITLQNWSVEQVADSILSASGEGQAIYPSGMSSADFVARMFTNAIGRAPGTAELAAYPAQPAGSTRGRLVAAMISSLAGTDGGDLLRETARIQFGARITAALRQTAAQAEASKGTYGAPIDLAHAIALTNPRDYIGGAVGGIDTLVSHTQLKGASSDKQTVDRWGNVLTVADPRNSDWKIVYRYNANNQLVDQAQSAGYGQPVNHITTRYDAIGRSIATTDARGFTNAMAYDANGNLVEELHADKGYIKYEVDLFGQRTKIIQGNNYLFNDVQTSFSYAYDKLGNLLSRTSAPAMVYYAMDQNGNGSATDMVVVNAAGVWSNQALTIVDQYQYDELGRRILTRNTNNGTSEYWNKTIVSSVRYDLSGNVISATDGNGATTKRRYDALQHKVAERAANAAEGESVSMSWDVDAFGRINRHSDLAQRVTTYSYNAAGQLFTQDTVDGQHLVYRYDSATGQVTEIKDLALYQITSYAYDRAGNRVAEKMVQYDAQWKNAQIVQDLTTRYDALGRMTDVQSAITGANYKVHYDYDGNGNRLHVDTVYTDDKASGQSIRTIRVSNTYDAMNRQSGVEGTITTDFAAPLFNEDGSSYTQTVAQIDKHTITYNGAGSRLSDTFLGHTESYQYDALGRLSVILKDNVQTGFRHYDGAGFLVESSDGIDMRANRYDAVGRLLRQRVSGPTSRDDYKYDVYYTDANGASYYDAAGYLTKYISVKGLRADAGAVTHEIVYGEKRDTLLETSTTASNSAGAGVTTKHYDVNGNLDAVDVGGVKPTGTVLLNDAAGHVLLKTETNASHVTSNIAHTLVANGEVIGTSDWNSESFSTGFEPVSSSGLSASSSTYITRANDTLAGIAKAIWGDASLWWQIADANGISDTTLVEGTVLRIPQRVNTVHNDYQTFKPYNASDVLGNTEPTLPALPPPTSGGGCGVIGTIIMVVVAVVVTIYTAGALSGLGGNLFAAGLNALGGAAGTAGTLGFAGGALAGAAGSVASQLVGNAIGAQDGFSWKSVALAAISAGAGAGMNNVGALAGEGWEMVAARAAVGNVASQGIGIATGLQKSFQWRNVAAATVGAVVGNSLAPGKDVTGFAKLAGSTFSGIAAGVASAVVRGGRIEFKQVAADAFGNALGGGLVESMRQTPGAPTKTFQQDVDERKNSVPEWARPAQPESGQDYVGAYSEAALAPNSNGATASTSSAASGVASNDSTKPKVNDIGLTDNQVLLGKEKPSGWFDSTIDLVNKTVSVNINVKYDTSTLTGPQATRLMSLTHEGVSQFWSRSIDLNGDTYAVNVSVSEDEKGMPIRLKIDNGKEYVRSFNTNGASFPFSVPGATINYQQGFSGGNMDWADKDYQLVAAHEIGHPILTLAGGREYSWSHEGTSGTFGADNGRLAPVPKTGEMNLMKYYEDATVNMKYARSIASESDVKNLIYISKHR